MLCGASFINQRFEEHLLEKLASETYLVANGITLESIAQEKTLEFENGAKRDIDTTKPGDEHIQFKIPNLRKNTKKKFFPNNLFLDK
jgi:hypothetical protein